MKRLSEKNSWAWRQWSLQTEPFSDLSTDPSLGRPPVISSSREANLLYTASRAISDMILHKSYFLWQVELFPSLCLLVCQMELFHYCPVARREALVPVGLEGFPPRFNKLTVCTVLGLLFFFFATFSQADLLSVRCSPQPLLVTFSFYGCI